MTIYVSHTERIGGNNYSVDMDASGMSMLLALAVHGNNFPGQTEEAKAFYKDLISKINCVLGRAEESAPTVNAFAHPKIHSFPRGLTVAELKPIVAAWPDVGRDGEPAEVWIEDGPGASSLVRSVWPLNSQFKENSETIIAADILFQIEPN